MRPRKKLSQKRLRTKKRRRIKTRRLIALALQSLRRTS